MPTHAQLEQIPAALSRVLQQFRPASDEFNRVFATPRSGASDIAHQFASAVDAMLMRMPTGYPSLLSSRGGAVGPLGQIDVPDDSKSFYITEDLDACKARMFHPPMASGSHRAAVVHDHDGRAYAVISAMTA